MTDNSDFQKTVENIMNNPESYSKEELYDFFLEMTEKFLNELLSSLNYEYTIIQSLGEEAGNEVIERASTANPIINSVDSANCSETDINQRIANLFIALNKMQSNGPESSSTLRLE